MNKLCRKLLGKLLDAWQRNPDRDRTRLPITEKRAADYFQIVLPEEREALHAALEEAEAIGAVTLEWGRGYESHILQRITLNDGATLAKHLNVPLATELAGNAKAILESTVTGAHPWIVEWVDELLFRWGQNQALNGIEPGAIEMARMLTRVLEAVADGRQRNLDLRTFSVRELGNSKALEGLLPKFAAVWKRYHPSDLTKDELMETLGLVKFPQPLLLRGPIVLKLTGRELVCEGIVPFIGLPPQAIQGIRIRKNPAYVLTVENLASFNRYAVEVIDRGLVLYTAGFPAPGVADFIRMLDESLPGSVPFLHWGDLDEGGLKIFAFIQGLVKRNLEAHLMTPEVLTRFGSPSSYLRTSEVQKIAERHPATAPLARAMLMTVPPTTLEQENVDPVSPIGR